MTHSVDPILQKGEGEKEGERGGEMKAGLTTD